MAKKRSFRKSICINGERLFRRFPSKELAEAWYRNQLIRKSSLKNDLVYSQFSKETFGDFFYNEFMPQRRRNHPASTFVADEQRGRCYLVPFLGDRKLSQISPNEIRVLLDDIVLNQRKSPETRNRVRALISSIFNSALNRNPPLVSLNPTFGLRFSGKRVSRKKPSFLKNTKECLAYIKAAKSIDDTHLAYALLMLSCGPRKQEVIALRWSKVDFESMTVEISEKFIQITGEIIKGTKRGENSMRYAPMNEALAAALARLRVISKYNSDDDFVFCKPCGGNISPRTVTTMNDRIKRRCDLSVTVHGLRHTFGREFADRSGGNMMALKDILGHSSLSTTQIYSELNKDRLNKYKDIVTFKTEDTDE